MAYKQKGCTPITAKIQKGTKGGIVAPLLKAMGVPMKASPYKVNEGPAPEPNKDSDISMTPYSKEKALYTQSGSRGKINGPKVSYDMAYDKAKKTERYANMSKADYIKEAKRQTKSFKDTGNWNANPKKPKAKAVSTIKSEPVKTIAPKVSVESKLTKAPSYDTSRITSKSKVVTPKKNRKDTRQENKANRKATRQENRTIRKNKRVERRSKR
jgi:hypothetical protein